MSAGEDRPVEEDLTDAELAAWSAAHRDAVEAPPELWPLVAAATIHRRAVRRQVLRSMRWPLLVGALLLVAATALVTWRVAHLSSARGNGSASSAAPSARAAPGPGQHAGHPTTSRSSRRGPTAPEAPGPPTPPEPGPRPKQ